MSKALFARYTLDGHDRGIITVINACRIAGMEVVYIHFSDPGEIVKSAVEEDVDIIGVTSSMGEHLYVASNLMKALRKGKIDIPVIFGGVIPNVDMPKLLNIGVKRVFGPGLPPEEAVKFISELTKKT